MFWSSYPYQFISSILQLFLFSSVSGLYVLYILDLYYQSFNLLSVSLCILLWFLYSIIFMNISIISTNLVYHIFMNLLSLVFMDLLYQLFIFMNLLYHYMHELIITFTWTYSLSYFHELILSIIIMNLYYLFSWTYYVTYFDELIISLIFMNLLYHLYIFINLLSIIMNFRDTGIPYHMKL